MSILDYLQRIINQTRDQLAFIAQLVVTLITSGWSAVVLDAARAGLDVHSLLHDPDCGQEAQCAKLTTVIGDLASLSTALAALGAPQQTGSPVTLPTTPPAGYGGASSGDVATAVWNHANYSGYAMGDTMKSLVYLFDGINSNLGFPSPTGGPFVISANIGAFNDEPWRYTPDYSFDSILTTDADVGAWLNRVRGRGETWVFDSDTLLWRTFGLGQPTNNTTWYCTVTEVQFAWIKAQLSGSTLALAPVWPGLANVTFDVPTAFADVPFTVVGPMDGVVISITSVPQPNAQYGFNGTVSYRYLGSITFEDDNGDCEFAQSLGFQSAIYVPAHMNHASFCRIRPNKSGIVGTVTPWTKN